MSYFSLLPSIFRYHIRKITCRGCFVTMYVYLVNKHYRETLTPQDLIDPHLVEESYIVLDELTQILDLGSIYEFQT